MTGFFSFLRKHKTISSPLWLCLWGKVCAAIISQGQNTSSLQYQEHMHIMSWCYDDMWNYTSALWAFICILNLLVFSVFGHNPLAGPQNMFRQCQHFWSPVLGGLLSNSLVLPTMLLCQEHGGEEGRPSSWEIQQ